MMDCSHHFLASDSDETAQSTQIKVCGITRTEDAQYAAQCGVGAIGLVFYPPSGRNISPLQARAIRDSLPSQVATVAVVVNPDDQMLDAIVRQVKPTYIQFHGDEPASRCREPGLPFIKALRVRHSEQILQAVDSYPDACGLLLDAYESERVGGTGKTFSWKFIPRVDIPIILAGGLHSGNVAEAIGKIRPAAVDVSTGVEFSEGVKNPAAVKAFVNAVLTADRAVELNRAE